MNQGHSSQSRCRPIVSPNAAVNPQNLKYHPSQMKLRTRNNLKFHRQKRVDEEKLNSNFEDNMTQRLLSPREEFQNNATDMPQLTNKKLTGKKRTNNQPIGKWQQSNFIISAPELSIKHS